MSTPPASSNPKTRTHHKYGPSKMAYLDKCAAFSNRQGTTEASEQGEMLHDLMEKMVRRCATGTWATTTEQLRGWVFDNHELADDEQECLRFCCQRVDQFLAKHPQQVLCELKLVIRGAGNKIFNSGYADLILVFKTWAVIIDFKFGWEPVAAAEVNLQGWNYALGVFQHWPHIQKVGVQFMQPKLGLEESHVFDREDMPRMFARLQQVVADAEYVKKNPSDAQRHMQPGPHCQWCARSASCAVLANHRGVAVARMTNLPIPPSFNGMELTKPEQVALLRYWVDVIEAGIEEIKQRAFEVAEANGGSLTVDLPNGQRICYEVQERGFDRSLGATVDVADCLKDIVTPEEVMGASKLSLGALEKVIKNAGVEAAAAVGEKITKKAAWESAVATLEANGLLSKPDGRIRFLKLKKEMPNKALPVSK